MTSLHQILFALLIIIENKIKVLIECFFPFMFLFILSSFHFLFDGLGIKPTGFRMSIKCSIMETQPAIYLSVFPTAHIWELA